MTSLGLDLPVLIDNTQLIGEGLGVTRVAQAFVIDPKTWKVVYSGPIDDRFAGKTAKPTAKVKNAYVSDAVASLVAGQAVKVSTATIDTPDARLPAARAAPPSSPTSPTRRTSRRSSPRTASPATRKAASARSP